MENYTETMNVITGTMKIASVKFVTWLEDNAWTAVWSEELKRRAYVNASENKILVHGSDYHFTKLIKEHGKDLDELYDMFVIDERKRLEKLNNLDVTDTVTQR